MTDNRIYYQQPLLPVQKPGQAPPAQPSAKTPEGQSFNQVLAQELTGVKFSQHALQRLSSRNIQLDRGDLAKISGAVDKAAQKGARDSLILMNNLALVVSVKNRTVITAMDGANIRDNVFTNIDSAVIV
ncbi:TIGR02530 family flagellar biosynthesis protein [Anaeroselena agilis]|uniref:TIGR02530 family flagellar biosynthesis protein n=1 Tax=Anaeroselena agilis TaxID=3063788 RepID=A0ABU3NWW2_9FIRM|nr:TIGR02530 family flagellar biosynthesis protein [Selenomonadales bacterium 4137-cl]